MCNPTQFGEGFLRSNKAIIVNQTTKPSFVIKRRGIDDNNSGRNIFTENWIWRLFARGDELKKNVDWYHSVIILRIFPHFKNFPWNQISNFSKTSITLYYCTIISRDALKLPITRESFSSQGAKPRGMKKWLPRDWQFQCIPRNDRAIVFLHSLLNEHL